MFEELIGKRFPVLDDGHVSLVAVMGSDQSICQAARISYGKGTRSVSDDRTLLRYLMRHRHTSPFEMAEIQVYARAPIEVARQWLRTRTASVNEYSMRYSEAIDSMHATAPDAWRCQSEDNKQGSGEGEIFWPSGEIAHASCQTFGEQVTPGDYLSAREKALQSLARSVYKERLAAGVAREQARKDLPLSTYTEFVFKIDLHNALRFLSLRMDSHAQEEIREYATIIGERIVAPLFPLTWDAFRDYVLNAVTLSAKDIKVVREYAKGNRDLAAVERLFPNRRERDECIAKLARLGFID